MPKVHRTAASRKDYFEIFFYIARDNIDAAERTLRRFDEKIELIASMPGIGTDRAELRSGVRSYPVGNYLIFYRVIDGGIEVLRVIHGARDLRRIFNPE